MAETTIRARIWRQAGRNPSTRAMTAAMMTPQMVMGSRAEASTSPRGSPAAVGTTLTSRAWTACRGIPLAAARPAARCWPTVLSSCATVGLAALASRTVMPSAPTANAP